MIKKLGHITLLFIVLTGCNLIDQSINTELDADNSSSVKTVVKESTPNFTFDGFTYSHQKTIDGNFYTETYRGTGKIVVTTDLEPEQNYLVLVNVRKISGGNEYSSDTGPQNVIVRNGVGIIRTFDSEYREEKADKFTQPIYEVDILGYIEYNKIGQ